MLLLLSLIEGTFNNGSLILKWKREERQNGLLFPERTLNRIKFAPRGGIKPGT
jgi:hypothetical protein